MSMASSNQPPNPEREQTDESLRVERENADRALEDKLTAIDESADNVISRARARADAVLAAARDKTDRKAAAITPAARSSAVVQAERGAEDRVLRGERADADEAVRAEREGQAAVLAREREETDKDLLAERARADAALAMRDDYLGIVSHDLRNMLGAMVGHAEMITSVVTQADHVPRIQKHAQRIQRSGARMNRLIGDLVDVASIEAGMLKVTREAGDAAPVAIEAVEAFQLQALARGVSLAVEVEPPAMATFDPARILQVLTNLLSNALKFTPENGKVVVRVIPATAELRIAVSDTGSGIATDQLESIFARFYQVTPNAKPGAGLGLYISKCIVQGHGGRIWAESSVGVGSTFSFTLPRQIAA